MNKISLFLLVLVSLFSISISFAQNILEGKVVDRVTKEPLESAVVTDLNSSKHALTDKAGKFILKGQKAIDSISISFLGYSTKKMKPIFSQQPFLIQLEKGSIELKEVVISIHSNNLTNSHIMSMIDLNMQPVKSAQDLLRLVPGLFIAQHQGGGKAEQIFLRGFDADHGTDVNISVDGMPVNMVSHAHGQGYADLHFLIPETVQGYDFGKGPYYANKGDFNTAGYISYHTKNVLEKNMIKLEGGQFASGRVVAMVNLLGEKSTKQTAYLAGEAMYTNGGPFTVPEHFNRWNLFGKFNSALGNSSKLTISLSTLSSGWRSSGEIPDRALGEGYITSRFGAIDSLQGGYTSRSNINANLVTHFKNNFTLENQAYYSRYFFNLISNFTFNYFYPSTGDEFRQRESRDLIGYNAKISHPYYIANMPLYSVAGIGLRHDAIQPSMLAHVANGGDILNDIQLGHTRETALNAYVDEMLEYGKWLFDLGLRFDYLHFYYFNQAEASDSAAVIFIGANPRAGKAIVSPKINIQYTLNNYLQAYLKMGKGFHSNDARIVIANQGYEILPAAYAADLGVNWKPLPGLFINAAIWYLYLQQEFTFGSDLGDQSVIPGGKTKRTGIDFSARYQFNDWLFGFLNIDLAKPRAIGAPKGNDFLPLAPTFTSTAGLDMRLKNGINASISYRYMHNRPGNEDNSLVALGYWVTDLSLGYYKKKYEIGLSVENLLNVEWNESQFEYLSRLKNETMPVDEMSYTPGVPFFAKLKFSIFF